MKRGELPGSVLERRAIVYVRQSSMIQVEENLESLAQRHGAGDRTRYPSRAERRPRNIAWCSSPREVMTAYAAINRHGFVPRGPGLLN